MYEAPLSTAPLDSCVHAPIWLEQGAQLSLGREKSIPRQTQTRTESAPPGAPLSETRLPRRDTQIVQLLQSLSLQGQGPPGECVNGFLTIKLLRTVGASTAQPESDSHGIGPGLRGSGGFITRPPPSLLDFRLQDSKPE